jgi:hypothetical protein
MSSVKRDSSRSNTQPREPFRYVAESRDQPPVKASAAHLDPLVRGENPPTTLQRTAQVLKRRQRARPSVASGAI